MTQAFPHTARLRAASRDLVRKLGLLRDDWDDSGFSATQVHSLIEIGSGAALTATDLAQRLALDLSTLSRSLAGLRRRGLIVTAVHPIDRRSRVLRLTPGGRRALQRVNRHADRQVEEALAHLKVADRDAVLHGIELYAGALARSQLARGCRIRRIRRSDNQAVAAIIREVMTEYGATGEGTSIHDPEVDHMYEAYSGRDSVYFVVEQHGEILGGAGVAPLQNGPPGVCELRKMYFRTRARGLGLGRAMLDRCLAAARDLQFKTCYLETLQTMTDARRLYEAAGFTRLEARMGDTGHPATNDFYAMELRGEQGAGSGERAWQQP